MGVSSTPSSQSIGCVISLALCMYHVGSHIEQYPAFPFFGFHQRQ